MTRTLLAVSAAAWLLCCRPSAVVEANDPNLQAIGGRLVYAGKVFSGEVRSYIPAIDEVEFTRYRHGIQHGLSRKESADGSLLAEMPYYAGAKHGVHRSWNRDGRLVSYAQFEMGEYTGDAWLWHASGAPYELRKYDSAGQLLLTRRWRENGQIYLNQVFLDGAAIGLPGSKLCDPTAAARRVTRQTAAALQNGAAR